MRACTGTSMEKAPAENIITRATKQFQQELFAANKRGSGHLERVRYNGS